MIRLWLSLLLFAQLMLAPAGAQQKAPAISADQARAALDMLNDPKKRAAFTATLQAIVKAQPTPPPAAEPANPPAETIALPLAPNSLGAEVLLTGSAFVNEIGNELSTAFQTVQSFPLLWSWAIVMATNPLGQQLLIDAAWRLGAALVLAIAVELALHRLMRRPLARVLRHAGRATHAPADPETRAELGDIEPPRRRGLEGTTRLVGLGLAWLALRLVPVLGLLAAGHAVAASSIGGSDDAKLVILAVIDAIAASQTLLAVLTLLVSPDPPGLKLLDIPREAGAYLMRWGRRLILIAVPGYTFGEVGVLLSLSAPAHDVLQKTIGLALAICLAVMIVQKRRPVRRWLSAPSEADGPLYRLRNRLAKHWYWVALFFLAASWLTWTLRAPDAIGRSLWYFGATAAVLAGAALARVAVNALVRRLAGLVDGTHSIQSRIGAYHPVIRQLARLAVNVLAVLCLLQLYGLGALTWLLTSEIGHSVASGFGTIAVTIGLAMVAWESVNIAIQMHLETLGRDAQLARSARLRTLLPLIRTTLAITVIVVAGLMVLSEIGVNIAPLLAGAGIAGVAIGFGSQRLVQDVITGMFLLLENTMQVGDVVRVGDQVGTVESLSVRTIRLRLEDGAVAVIPFSGVTTVINRTRDFSQAVIAVDVAITEDIDRVTDALRDIVSEMRADEAWRSIILDDFEVQGLDKVTDSGLSIAGRIKCTAFGRLRVRREFNRRMVDRFQKLGIALPDSSTRLVLDGPVRMVAAESGRPPGGSVPVDSR